MIGFQYHIPGAGLEFSRVFNIDPTYRSRNRSRTEILIERNSEVEIYLNNQLIKREFVRPGPLELNNFPFFTGFNEVVVKVIDDLGFVTEHDFSTYFDARITAPGVSDYSFSLKIREDLRSENRMKEYIEDEPIFQGFYRKGIRNDLLFGVNSTISSKEVILGGENIWSEKYGAFTTNFAVNYLPEEKKAGHGLRVDYQSPIWIGKERNTKNFRLLAEYNSEFFNVNQSVTDNTFNKNFYSWNLEAFVSQNYVSDFKTGFGVRYSFGRGIVPNKKTFFANSTWNVFRNFRMGASFQNDLANSNNSSLMFSLNWIGNNGREQLFSSYDPYEERSSSFFQYNPEKYSNRFRMALQHNSQRDFNSFGGRVNYVNQRMELQAYQQTAVSEEAEDTHFTQLNFSTGIAFAGDVLAITRPIADSFALLDLSKYKVPFDRSIHLNRHKGRSAGAISWMGPASLSHLASYNYSSINIDTSSLPIGVTVNKEQFLVRPSYKSGFGIELTATGNSSAKGKIKGKDGTFVTLTFGEVRLVGSNKPAEEFFTNRAGEFFIERLSGGSYELFIDGHDLPVKKFTVEENSFSIIDLGVLSL